jgi:hypothetical protein
MSYGKPLGFIGHRQDLQLGAGDDFEFDFELKTRNEFGELVPIPLAGFVIDAHIKKSHTDALIAVNGIVTIVDAQLGKCNLLFAGADTQALEVGQTINDPKSIYFWDMKMRDAASKVHPIYYGDVRILRKITSV